MTQGSELANVDDVAPTGEMQMFNWKNLHPSQIKGVAQIMAASGMFPDVKSAASAYVKIMAGQEMGISPFQAMSDISIIQGKAAAGGNIYASKVKSSGKYDYKVTYWERDGCKIEFFQNINGKRESIGVSSFMAEDATAAQLINKDNWKKWARNMYFNRAITAGVRTFCPDALGGVNAYTAEELGVETIDENGQAIYTPEAKPAKPKERRPVDAEVTTPPPAAPAEPKKPAAKKVNKTQELIQQVGKELEAKGFEDATDRQTLAFKIGDVTKASELDEEGWAAVLAQIKELSTDDLTDILSPPIPDHVAEASRSDDDEDPMAASEMPENFLKKEEPADTTVADAMADATPAKWTMPTFKQGSSPLPRPEQRDFAKKLYGVLGLETETAQKNYNKGKIGKVNAGTFDEMTLLLDLMIDEANEKEAGDGAGA